MDALPEFQLLRPTTLADVLAARAAHPASRLIGGGTDLIVNIRRGIEAHFTRAGHRAASPHPSRASYRTPATHSSDSALRAAASSSSKTSAKFRSF